MNESLEFLKLRDKGLFRQTCRETLLLHQSIGSAFDGDAWVTMQRRLLTEI